MTLLNLFLIQLIIVGAGHSGFWEDGFEPMVKKIIGMKVGTLPKLFHCSLCQTFWTSLLYLLFTKNFTLPYIAASMGFALLTPIPESAIVLVKDILNWAITMIYKLFNI